MKKITVGVVVAIALIGVFLFFQNTKTEEAQQDSDKATEKNKQSETDKKDKDDPAYKYPPEKIPSLLDEQKKLEASILSDSEGSTLDDPYVKLDPYNRSPLAALVIFNTDKPAKVSFTVHGKEDKADISKSFEYYKKQHELPVLGLYPDYSNTLEIKAETKSGETMTKTLTITTDELPDYIPDITIKTADTTKMDIQDTELTFAIPSTKFVYGFDANGDIRWYGSGYNSHVFQELNNGHLLYLGKDDNSGTAYNRLFETDYMGKLYNAFKISKKAAHAEAKGMESTLIHHDAAELPSGNLILTVNDGEGEYMEDTMIEIDRETGDVVKQIDLKNMFPEQAYQDYDSTEAKEGLTDWFHQNSVVYDKHDNSIIISGRNSDTVMKIDYESEEIKWMLAYPEGWNDDMQQHLLEGQGEDFKYPGGQHDANILPDFDNNPDTLDLLLYDNNVAVTRGDEDLSKQFSAATHYRINEKTKEAEVIWTYGKERGEAFFTNIIGSARYQQNTGNVLVDFGHVDSGDQSNIVEVTHHEDSKVVFEAEITNFPKGAWVYRSVRYPLYTDTWENTFKLSE
ncbi:aryl-sulfate sulfotransferase [Lentibacillus kapialis]|uniref:Aryl-sulfate sulfotransferase n=1 Tax=Lentibacillus kapialis TaxID=340214 RepID=A0A917PYS4_9BACI|nr:aryl-sulfate sulfotransferase [Lentibacillus kapialis]GGK01714.1 aryl-sulfate sulfotransferase [Lentibacillus kapialis]